MRKVLLALATVAALSKFASAQAAPGAYAGQEHREIKALSEKEAAAYEAGEGMGYAKAAELNQYPGPRHVLELARELKLTAEQEERTRRVHGRMRDRAVAIGRSIVARERDLDALFAERRVTAESLARATAEIGRLQGELRATHLAAHLETRALLTPDQIAAYDGLRGYGKGKGKAHSGHHPSN